MTEGAELTKRCSDCGVEKSTSQYGRNRTRPDGLQHVCKECKAVREAARPQRDWSDAARAESKVRAEARRNAPKPDLAARQREWKEANPDRLATLRKRAYAKKYGLMPEDLDKMYADQHGMCAVCLIDIEFGSRNGLHVDHDHYSGKVRALLCGPCNSGLGMFQDSAEFLRRAATYIAFWNVIREAADAESL